MDYISPTWWIALEKDSLSIKVFRYFLVSFGAIAEIPFMVYKDLPLLSTSLLCSHIHSIPTTRCCCHAFNSGPLNRPFPLHGISAPDKGEGLSFSLASTVTLLLRLALAILLQTKYTYFIFFTFFYFCIFSITNS